MDSFTVKLIVLRKNQYSYKQKKPEVENNANTVKKCLFGVSDPEDTENMLRDQQKIEEERFEQRFGFSIEEFENFENSENVKFPGLRCGAKSERKVVRRTRRVFKPYNQRVLTDFFRERKALCSDGKEKEN